jgi:dihydroxyacetone kinase-like protein
LWPAIEALQASQKDGKSLAQALADAAAAAAAGATATKPLRSKFGRAAWMQDRTVGVEDPGARVVAVVVNSLAEYVRM